MFLFSCIFFFFSSRRRHTRCALVTGVQTCALPILPERELFVGRLDGTIAGSAQLMRPPRNNEAQNLTGQLTTFFVAPWARGHGLAPALVARVEEAARASGQRVLNLDVRETQARDIGGGEEEIGREQV